MLRLAQNEKPAKKTEPAALCIFRGLSKQARQIAKQIEDQWILDDGARMNLFIALKNFDRREEAERLIAKEGLFLDGKKHPALQIAKDCDLILLKAWRSIGLDVEPPNHQIGRPVGSGGRK